MIAKSPQPMPEGVGLSTRPKASVTPPKPSIYLSGWVGDENPEDIRFEMLVLDIESTIYNKPITIGKESCPLGLLMDALKEIYE